MYQTERSPAARARLAAAVRATRSRSSSSAIPAAQPAASCACSRVARGGGEYDVPPGGTILGVLRRHGIDARSACELGYCAACLTRYLAGEVDHRDPILGDVARRTHLLICCSRATSEVLVLDL